MREVQAALVAEAFAVSSVSANLGEKRSFPPQKHDILTSTAHLFAILGTFPLSADESRWARCAGKSAAPQAAKL